MTDRFDVLGLGCTAVDDFLYVDAYPESDAKTQVRGRERQCGGLTLTALLAAAKLGCRCAYAGALGNDEASQFILQRMAEAGIDVSQVYRQAIAKPIRSTIIVDQTHNTRTILFDMENVIGAVSNWPPEEVIRNSKVLIIDHCGMDGMIRAASIASNAKIPIVADLEVAESPQFHALLALVDHVIVSRDFALKFTGMSDVNAAAQSLWTPVRQAVVVTCGKDGCWYLTRRNSMHAIHLPAMEVKTVDTTGCGDVFHGAYAAALVQGRDIPQAVQYASIAAGIKATCRGGTAGIPDNSTVERQLHCS